MRVQVISAFSLGGGKDVYEGDLVELPEPLAKVRIAQGFVVEAPVSEAEKGAAAAAPEPAPAAAPVASSASEGDPVEGAATGPEQTPEADPPSESPSSNRPPRRR